MTERQQRLCLWAGISFAPMFLVGFVFVAGFIPPPAPSMTADEVAYLFAHERDRIRIGMWIATAAAPLLAFYVAAISHQIRRISGAGSPLATAQLASGTCLILEFIFPQLVWQTAAYRGDRSAETIQMLNDLAWLPFVGVVGTAIVQMAIVAIVVLQDRRPQPLLPRWSAYLSIWAAFGVASGSLVVFTQTGPVAWNGLLACYLLCVSFFVWMVAMTWSMLRASHAHDDSAPEPRISTMDVNGR